MYEGDPRVALILAVGYGLWAGSSRFRFAGRRCVEQARDWFETDTDPIDEIHRQYRNGEFGEVELERRLELHMDTRNERIRNELLNVDGVGGAVAAEVAVSFDSLGSVAVADRDELTEVPDVGEKRADRIYRYFGDQFRR
jgi:ERCC4-type nuclease